jgi:hypothetical protein
MRAAQARAGRAARRLRSAGAMRALRTAIAIALLSGCGASGLSSSDGGAPGGGASDLAMDTCAQIPSTVQKWLDAHVACVADSDCVVVSTACGLPGMCGWFANTSALDPYIQKLVAYWANVCSAGAGECLCPASLPAYGCNAGVCGVKRFVVPPGPVGAPCTGNADCATDYCLTARIAPAFVGGYCTVAACDTRDIACPAGSTCEPGGDGRGYCLAQCDTRASRCRSGYDCCGGSGVTDPATGWCTPPSTPLCLAP